MIFRHFGHTCDHCYEKKSTPSGALFLFLITPTPPSLFRPTHGTKRCAMLGACMPDGGVTVNRELNPSRP